MVSPLAGASQSALAAAPRKSAPQPSSLSTCLRRPTALELQGRDKDEAAKIGDNCCLPTCNRVLIQSSGCVTKAAMPPAAVPDASSAEENVWSGDALGPSKRFAQPVLDIS
mmetsp:Transcript_33352/g.72126  ORF Transcript_33352/g.72126 Transcript_33352/m.72126 type:complete len:111 (+) Transcript_33352:99-431(+)